LTIDKLTQIVPELATGQVNSVNGTNLCTACAKQTYNVAKGDFPAIFGQGTTIASDLQNSCGASFVGESIIFRLGFKTPTLLPTLIDLC